MTPLSTVETFPKGVANPTDPPCGAANEVEAEALRRSLTDAVQRVKIARLDKNPDLLLLVASFDRSTLTGRCYSKFKTNVALATQRARWVIAGLMAADIATDNVQLIVSGPTAMAGDASHDRAVAVYRILTKE